MFIVRPFSVLENNLGNIEICFKTAWNILISKGDVFLKIRIRRFSSFNTFSYITYVINVLDLA